MDDSTETEKSEKTIRKKKSEPSSDEPNPKAMKIKLPLSKSVEKRFSSMLQEDDRITKKPRRKKGKNTGTFGHCTSSNSRSR